MNNRSLKAKVLRLATLAFVCGTGLSLTSQLTEDTINTNKNNYLLDQLRSVAGSSLDSTIHQIQPDIYEVSKEGVADAHIFKISTMKGYNGEISLLLGVDTNGIVRGARVIDHQETPGLGDRIDHQVSDWIAGFEGQSLQSARWKIKKDDGDFDQFTGATITPRAVVDAIHEGLLLYEAKKADWLNKNED